MLIVDDHPVYRRGLRQFLEPPFEVVGEAGEGGTAVDLALALRPDVVVMDIHLPGMTGLAAAREIKAQRPETQVVIVSASDDDAQVFEAIRVGVSGYVVKHDAPECVIEAVACAARGEVYLPPGVTRQVLAGVALSRAAGHHPPCGGSTLSTREYEVVRLMAQGHRNDEIADLLCISKRTLSNHITNIYAKLNVETRAEVIGYAIRQGLVRL